MLAGLEVIETLRPPASPRREDLLLRSSPTRRARFLPDMLGSLVYVGGMSVEEAHAIEGIDGATVGGELDRIGYLGPALLPAPAPHAR